VALDAFNRELGTRQGRIKPAGVIAPSGDWVCVLGFDGFRTEELAPGDFVQIEQEATFTAGTKLLRVTCIVAPPATIPTGYKWILQLLVDDVVYAEHRLVAGGRTRTRSLAANVSKLAGGNHFATVRLWFVTDDTQVYSANASAECGP
jgi:hypothetical protein